MSNQNLLFYDAYEQFYAMADDSEAFRLFCADAFGRDFSQDGFSNLEQIDSILPHIPKGENVHILDIGCGNGKMLGYLQEKTGAFIHGFDYSNEAIRTAKRLFPSRSAFREGIIGEMEYPPESFDVIISMDTMYFAKDMNRFAQQLKGWLKPDGVFFAGYQEGDVVPRTAGMHTTLLACALRHSGMPYEGTDITEQTYALLQKKREAALAHKAAFLAEGQEEWFQLMLLQTECALEEYAAFRQKMARYIYIAHR